ncbi:putative pap 25a associated domain family [Blattamonas nauphoetae]|uniref:Pap 25a associated domain family n=1 Tax=Blattamonas nauphoetae TaxID=2049346 RepID=A0ABQ9YK95_9EUKA|nr:putative pap 25a associated domain family [Blattamonas nauphoetae]
MALESSTTCITKPKQPAKTNKTTKSPILRTKKSKIDGIASTPTPKMCSSFCLPEINPISAERIEQTRSAIESSLKREYPAIIKEVSLFGSVRSSLFTGSSDIDFNIFFEPNCDTPTIEDIAKALRSHNFTIENVLPNARVPVIQGLCLSNVWNLHDLPVSSPVLNTPFDLVLMNSLGVYNSEMIATYCKCDNRVRPFLLLVKQWSKAWNIGDSKQRKLSSYGWTLLGLFFLQTTSPPIIPSLQNHTYLQLSSPSLIVDQTLPDGRVLFSNDPSPWLTQTYSNQHTSETTPHFHQNTSNSPLELQTLFKSFIIFCKTFDVSTSAVSVRDGHPIPRSEVEPTFTRKGSQTFFAIVDPFQFGRNVADVVRKPSVIRAAINKTAELLEMETPLDNILDPKWSEEIRHLEEAIDDEQKMKMEKKERRRQQATANKPPKEQNTNSLFHSRYRHLPVFCFSNVSLQTPRRHIMSICENFGEVRKVAFQLDQKGQRTRNIYVTIQLSCEEETFLYHTNGIVLNDSIITVTRLRQLTSQQPGRPSTASKETFLGPF